MQSRRRFTTAQQLHGSDHIFRVEAQHTMNSRANTGQCTLRGGILCNDADLRKSRVITRENISMVFLMTFNTFLAADSCILCILLSRLNRCQVCVITCTALCTFDVTCTLCCRHVSFVDCPGHDILMATMLNGAAVMDAALLLIAANESCPQPQTSEHLAAIEIMKLKHIIILQNKIDLVKETQATEQHEQILKFVQGTVAEGKFVFCERTYLSGALSF